MGQLDGTNGTMTIGLAGAAGIAGAGGESGRGLCLNAPSTPLGGRLATGFAVLRRLFADGVAILGREHLRDLPAAVVFAGPRHSEGDASLVREALGEYRPRRFRRMLVTVGARRGANSPSILVTLLRQGHSLVIFAGSKTDPKAGLPLEASRLAEETGVPVVPFGIAGTASAALSEGYGFAGRQPVGIPRRGDADRPAIVFGAPLTITEGESAAGFATRVREASLALTREAELAAVGSRRGRANRGTVLPTPARAAA